MRWFSTSRPQVPQAVPDALPVLSTGRHRTPRTGACFMEWASLLAGERFSDHPSCTHPLLAHLARMVNDATSDAGRAELAPLVPSVVGLTSEDPRWAHDVAVAAAVVALPLATEDDRRALAAGILTCERLRALHSASPSPVRPATLAALRTTPEATAWATDFTEGLVSLRAVHDPAAVLAEHAVVVVVRLGRADTDALLARMLRDAITAVGGTALRPAALAGREPAHRRPAYGLTSAVSPR